jgi:hypothetical protein
MIFLAETWIFPVQSWMMNRKMSEMKMRRITTTVLEEMIITIWMRIRMIYREVELITKYLYLCPRLNTKTVS